MHSIIDKYIQKTAFVPLTPFVIKDRKEYDSPSGKTKREVNEHLSRLSGMGIGVASGAAIGRLIGAAMNTAAPGKLDLNMRVFDRVKRESGVQLAAPYIKNYMKQTGKRPTHIPPGAYMPIYLGLLGAAAGMFPAEYKAKRKMERDVGIDPGITEKEFIRKDVYPAIGGGAAGALVGAIAASSMGKALAGNMAVPIAGGTATGAGVSIAVERLLANMAEKHNKQNSER